MLWPSPETTHTQIEALLRMAVAKIGVVVQVRANA